MSGLHWFPFYWADYSSKTMHLSQGQHGTYMLLLRWIYTTGGPVPDKQRYSIAQARLKQEIENVDTILGQFFIQDGEVWRNSKAEDVISGAADRHEKFAAAGRAGGLKRSSNAKATLKPRSTNYNHTQNNKEESKKEAAPAAQSFVLPDFIPDGPWEDFLEMRKRVRAVPTLRARQLLAVALEKLMVEGHDPAAVLNQSTQNNWKGVFPLNNGGHNGRSNGKAATQLSTIAEGAILAAKRHNEKRGLSD